MPTLKAPSGCGTAAEQIFGFAADDAIGASLDLIIPERLRDAHWRGYRGQSALRPSAIRSRLVRFIARNEVAPAFIDPDGPCRYL